MARVIDDVDRLQREHSTAGGSCGPAQRVLLRVLRMPMQSTRSVAAAASRRQMLHG